MSVIDASRILGDDSGVMLQSVMSIADDSRGIIYDRNMFIVQATGFISACSIKPTLVFYF